MYTILKKIDKINFNYVNIIMHNNIHHLNLLVFL